MPTFLLKKYETTQSEQVNQKNSETPVEKEEENPEEMTIAVTDTISQIVATALYKVLKNTQVQIEEVEDTAKDANVKAISTENINKEPVDTLRFIRDNDFVFIHTTGFTTTQEDWFLTNIENKTKNVVYTIESFINYIKTYFKLN